MDFQERMIQFQSLSPHGRTATRNSGLLVISIPLPAWEDDDLMVKDFYPNDYISIHSPRMRETSCDENR